MITGDIRPSAAAPWMHVAEALLGEAEIAGSAHNPRIVELFRISGTPQFVTDETAWCAAKVNGCLVLAGYAGTKSALASSFASFGADLGNRPVYGCVVLFYPLASGSSGHVGFFKQDNGDGTIQVISGNDQNAVRDRAYPKDKVRAYRWPTVKGPLPAETSLPTILTLAPQDAPDHVRPGILRPPARPIITITPANNFERVHPLIAKWEGTEFTNHPRDKGGPTKFGITQQRLSEERGEPVSAADVAALTYAEALSIFRRRYWAPLRCDEMPIALAVVTYNAGVNSGPARGGRFLQMALNRQGHGLDEDGDVGPKTLTAANSCDIAQAVKDYAEIYEAYYRRLDDFDVFGRGWLNRLDDIKSKALALSQEKTTVPDPQANQPKPDQPAPNTMGLDPQKMTELMNITLAVMMVMQMMKGGQVQLPGNLLPGPRPPVVDPPAPPSPPPVPVTDSTNRGPDLWAKVLGFLGGAGSLGAYALGAAEPATASAIGVASLIPLIGGIVGVFNPTLGGAIRGIGGLIHNWTRPANAPPVNPPAR